jgi:hypothetical protein
MLRALGGYQKIVARANCWHQKNADIWQDDKGGAYFSDKEMPVFVDTWGKLSEFRAAHPLDATAIPFLKKLLYRDDSYYASTRYDIYRNGAKVSSHQGVMR